MFELTTNEKKQVVNKLFELFDNKNELNFKETDCYKIFRIKNGLSFENYLRELTQKGAINFLEGGEDGFAAQFFVSLKSIKYLKNEWAKLNSKQKSEKAFLNNLLIMVILILIIFLFFIMNVYPLISSSYSIDWSFTLIASIIITFSVMYSFSLTLRRDQSKKEIDDYSEKLKNTIIGDEKCDQSSLLTYDQQHLDSEKDALKLMLVNMEEMKAYYTLSKSQAKSSFLLAAWTSICGFVLFSVAIALPFIVQQSVNVSIIPLVSGAIAELFAGSSLIVYRYTLKQLDHYYQSLHENEKFLSTVNLVRKLQNDQQDDMYIEIIKGEIENRKKQFT